MTFYYRILPRFLQGGKARFFAQTLTFSVPRLYLQYAVSLFFILQHIVSGQAFSTAVRAPLPRSPFAFHKNRWGKRPILPPSQHASSSHGLPPHFSNRLVSKPLGETLAAFIAGRRRLPRVFSVFPKLLGEAHFASYAACRQPPCFPDLRAAMVLKKRGSRVAAPLGVLCGFPGQEGRITPRLPSSCGPSA